MKNLFKCIFCKNCKDVAYYKSAMNCWIDTWVKSKKENNKLENERIGIEFVNVALRQKIKKLNAKIKVLKSNEIKEI